MAASESALKVVAGTVTTPAFRHEAGDSAWRLIVNV
jgi:hypothetical protein